MIQYQTTTDLPAQHRAVITGSVPDDQIHLVANGEIQAQCALWWHHTPAYRNHSVGLVGNYAATTDHAAAQLLAEACQRLAAHGCTLAVGPLDGTTWHRYRFVTKRGDEPAFFLEPDQPDEWPKQFRDHGFTPLAHYYSTKISSIGQRSQKVAKRREHLLGQGIQLRSFNHNNPDSDLQAIYRLSIQSFSANFLQSPIGEAAFLDQYRTLVPYLVPDLTVLAESDGQLVGFVFGVPDYLQRQRGATIDTVILKTAAIAPGMAYAGLGCVLAEDVQLRAYDLGFRHAIHALMHEQNPSRWAGHRYGAIPIRQYTLFARRLP